jgi:hypothetical protein
MLGMLDEIEIESGKNKTLYFKREVLVRSISANECPLITLTMKVPKGDIKK